MQESNDGGLGLRSMWKGYVLISNAEQQFEISLVGNVIHVETVEPSMVTKDVTLS